MKAHLHLIKYALADDYNISVFDGEAWEVRHSTSYKEIKQCIESVEECEIIIHSSDNTETKGWALILPYEDEKQTVCDFTHNEYLDHWWGHFYNL